MPKGARTSIWANIKHSNVFIRLNNNDQLLTVCYWNKRRNCTLIICIFFWEESSITNRSKKLKKNAKILIKRTTSIHLPKFLFLLQICHQNCLWEQEKVIFALWNIVKPRKLSYFLSMFNFVMISTQIPIIVVWLGDKLSFVFEIQVSYDTKIGLPSTLLTIGCTLLLDH